MEIDFKKIVKKITSFREKSTVKLAINPHRDWRTIFIVFVILTILVASGSVYMFSEIEKDELFTSGGDREKQVKKFNTAKLVDMIKQFEERERNLEMLRINRPNIIDPSQ